MPEESNYPKIPAGGAESAIDLTNERDRGLVRQAMKNWPKRWRGLTPERKERFADDLELASELARKVGDTEDAERMAEAAKALASIARTAIAMEAQNQSDEHHADKTAQDDKRLQLDAARTLSALPEAEKLALIHRAGLAHLLPPALPGEPDVSNRPPV